ncbi:MAG: hypothetical protein FJW30_07435 [Acidobacteria bacterium]|nr:hypothetical protein [Acidobacteriota bacterium]
MDGFLDTAARILDGALSAIRAGHAEPAWTVLMGGACGVQMVAGTDWPLRSLLLEHGADSAYRVNVAGRQVTVDGITRSRHCRLQSPFLLR